jgi:hypothetical protein
MKLWPGGGSHVNPIKRARAVVADVKDATTSALLLGAAALLAALFAVVIALRK